MPRVNGGSPGRPMSRSGVEVVPATGLGSEALAVVVDRGRAAAAGRLAVAGTVLDGLPRPGP